MHLNGVRVIFEIYIGKNFKKTLTQDVGQS
jgi:hypothetical protein